MHSILDEYEKILGQVVYVQKSGIFFSGNVPKALKSNISNKLGVHAPLNTGKYLGLPSLIGRNKGLDLPSYEKGCGKGSKDGNLNYSHKWVRKS